MPGYFPTFRWDTTNEVQRCTPITWLQGRQLEVGVKSKEREDTITVAPSEAPSQFLEIRYQILTAE